MPVTITEKVIWTLCPNGVEDGQLKIGVFISPRLTADGKATLSASSNWLHWTSVLDAAAFQLTLTQGGITKTVKNGDITRVSRTNRSAWASLFPGETPLKSFSFTDLRNKLFLSYPVAQMAAHFEEVYGKLGFSAKEGAMPAPQDLIDAGVPRGMPGRRSTKEMLDFLKNPPAAGKPPVSSSNSTPGMYDVFSFYHAPLMEPERKTYNKKGPDDPREYATWDGYKSRKMPSPDRLVERTDFHRIAAAVSNYEMLSRLCGLVVDLTIPLSTLVTAPMLVAGQVKIQLSVTRKGQAAPLPIDTFPTTLCTLDPVAKVFDPKAMTPATYDGRFYNLQSGGLDLIQLDVDGAAHKTMQVAGSLPNISVLAVNDDNLYDQTQPEVGAPALRSAGIMLAKTDRKNDVQKSVDRSGQLNDPTKPNGTGIIPDLYTEDLLRGFRVDIAELAPSGAQGPWHSLCQRNVIYTLLKPGGMPGDFSPYGWTEQGGTITGPSPVEEGVLSLALTSTPDNTNPEVYKLHEGLFAWRGWSLCAPEPSLSLRAHAAVPDGPTEADRHRAMVGPSSAEVPPGLPLQTEFRVAKGSLPKLRFGHRYVTRLRTVDLCGNSVPYTATAKNNPNSVSKGITYLRHEPVETPVLTLLGNDGVEAGHDLTTTPAVVIGAPKQGESMGRLAVRTFNVDPIKPADPPNPQKIARNLAPGRVTQRFAETHGVLDTAGKMSKDAYAMLAQRDVAFPAVALPSLEVPSDKATSYSVAEKKFSLPYLPDPYALGIMVRLQVLGAKTWQDLKVPFYGPNFVQTDTPKWPDSEPVLIEGSATYAALKWDAANRVIQIPMPLACRQRVRLSCMIPEFAIDRMAMWALIVKTAQDKKQDPGHVREWIRAGKHWMFTPWREIEFVHATQKPLIAPAFETFAPARGTLGQLDAIAPVLATPLDSKSTTRLDINASWSEPEDNPIEIAAKNFPIVRDHAMHVHQQTIARTESLGGHYTLQGIIHRFTDTRYRRVTYAMDAVSRFKEFFEPEIRNSEDKTKVTDAKHAVRWIYNTAPPPAPDILYAIPTFGWLRPEGKTASKRTGGIRIYLNRPWMATGYNEMLAVLLPNAGSAEASSDDARNKPFVTQWGRDPIRLSADIPTNSPPAAAFTLARTKGPIPAPGTDFPTVEGSDLAPGVFAPETLNGLTVPGQDGLYTVAPHQVGFDTDRQLWYADIAIAMPKGSYFPFVRLAVSRYQPTSIPGAHLSSSVTCDFMQLSADRIAVVVPIGTDGKLFHAFVYGDQPKEPLVEGIVHSKVGEITFQCQVLDKGLDEVMGWRDYYIGDGEKLVAVDVTYNYDPSTDPASTAKANQIAGQLAAAKIKLPEPKSTGGKAGQFGQVALPDQQFTTTGPQPIWPVPTLLSHGVIIAPHIPSSTRRRVLITETERYPIAPPLNHEEDPPFGERIVYAEGIEF